jgi:hypothetical protein
MSSTTDKLLQRFERALLRLPHLPEIWGYFRAEQLHRKYETRREHYAQRAQTQGLVYRESEVIKAVRDLLRKRGSSPHPRRMGGIHTFALVPDLGWHRELLPDLRSLGPLTVFDYVSLGFRWEEFWKADRAGLARRRAMNDRFWSALKEAHEARPVDWVFVYASGTEISAGVIRRISEELGIPTVNMCLDDKQSWTGPFMGDHSGGQIGIAGAFDLSWTSARVACDWYLVEGGRPIYLPEGFDASTHHPMKVEQDIPVSFIGGAYGYRPAVINYLLKRGVPVQTFGHGWPGSQWIANPNEIMNRSVINLGMGGIGYSERLTNVKGRDFEITGTGGGVYLTNFNADLARHFMVGDEILCYSHRNEMLELIRYYLDHPDEARAIGKRGHERGWREHRWLHRYQRILEILEILEGKNS